MKALLEALAAILGLGAEALAARSAASAEILRKARLRGVNRRRARAGLQPLER